MSEPNGLFFIDGQLVPINIEEVTCNRFSSSQVRGILCEGLDPMSVLRTLNKRVSNSRYGYPRNVNIEKVIFNDPATIVIWTDKTKTIVKCQPGDEFDKELGLAMCISKKYFGNKGNYNEVFKKFIPEEIDLSVEKKRDFLEEYCSGKMCIGCLLIDNECRCGKGQHFKSKRGNKYDMSDEQINRVYDKVMRKMEE